MWIADDKLRTQIEYTGQKRDVTFIKESGLYSLILSSKLPKARDALRKHVDEDDKGGFKMPTPNGFY